MKMRGAAVPEKMFHISKFGGQNTRTRDTALPPENGDIAENCRFTTVGSLLKRSPLSQLNDATLGSGPVTSLYRYYQSVGSNLYTLASCNGVMKTASAASSTFSTLQTLSTTDTIFDYVTYINKNIYSI